MGDSREKSVLLYRARDQIEASLLVAMLEESGVRAWTRGGQANIGFGELGADALLVDVRVLEPDHARAIGLVHRYFAEPRDELTSDHPWPCGACGESVEGSFSSCWSCGAPRESRPSSGPISLPDDEPLSTSAAPRRDRFESWRVRGVRLWLGLIFLAILAGFLASLGSLAVELTQAPAYLIFGLVLPLLFLPGVYVAARWSMGAWDRPEPRSSAR